MFLLCSWIIIWGHKHKCSFMDRPEKLQQVRNIWEQTSNELRTVDYSLDILSHMYQMGNTYSTLVSGFYYLLPTCQSSLCPRALLSPLEQKNTSQMLKITSVTRSFKYDCSTDRLKGGGWRSYHLPKLCLVLCQRCSSHCSPTCETETQEVEAFTETL